MDAAGASGDKVCEDLWQWACSPLANGRHAEKFEQRLVNLLGPRLLAKQLHPQETGISADVPEDFAIELGFEQRTHQKLSIHRDAFTGHVLIGGATGAGKTSFIVWLVQQLLRPA